ncbi:hypothetical protein HC248_00943 [Polaromonas vacuolata]|uniref:FimV N-terminal domain-containing protein n=1 Tax=Polaromonas vacuolata TaxID=37448 RepID=A0A6H2H705_9BURK|nr:FimV/HubP family polar landmark protein [Polaromonas vacuolata]QJC55661.1 hypothetical protein HC248_00943 [Polaromonas vacuolata]
MTNCNFRRFSALASAIALIGCLTSLDATALGLGRITVQSLLGQPIKAEVEIPQINAEELSSLQANIASPETFRAAGLSYSNVASEIVVSLQKRSNGSSYLRLTSTRPINEPFLDLIIEAKWSSGRIVRDYTMLFDPPQLNANRAATPTNPITLAAPAPAPVEKSRTLPAAPALKPSLPDPAAQSKQPETEKTPPRPAPLNVTPAKPAKSAVNVKNGDTAWGVVAANNKSGVSLDQMLIALLRLNPDAFVGNNVNRLKSGSLLEIPNTEQAQATAPQEATRLIVAQSKDFNDFRRKLAQGMGQVEQSNATRELGGKLQAKVEDAAAGAAAPDKLTLSKGAVQGKTASAEEKIANERQLAQNAARITELAKNIAELKRLTGDTSGPAANNAASSSAKSASDLALTVPSIPALATAAPTAVASQPSSSAANATATNPLAPASTAGADLAAAPAAASAAAASSAALAAPAASSSASKPAAPKAKDQEQDLKALFNDSAFLIPGLGLILLLLGALGLYRYRQRRNLAQVDSSFMESRAQADSFFGASGGQHIDTSDGGGTGSSLIYSPSQLDAGGDVDPVAEADVYLAYGRDLQAEEILTEALRSSPVRVAIHAKLLEIYAKRRDIKAFESLAKVASKVSGNVGPEWLYISEMGREIDPNNNLYKEGQSALDTKTELAKPAPLAEPLLAANTQPNLEQNLLASVQEYMPKQNNFADKTEIRPSPAVLDQATASGQSPIAEAAPLTAQSKKNIDFDLDISLDNLTVEPSTLKPQDPTLLGETANQAQASDPLSEGLDIETPSATYTPTQAFAESTPPATPPASPNISRDNVIEFDMGALSLDLEPQQSNSPEPKASNDAQSPLETKLALAQEFLAIGDQDGARTLAKEVLAQASGALKDKAQAFINALP